MPPFWLSTSPGAAAHAVGGNEGLFEVVSAGRGVSDLRAGDWALPRLPNFGTWRTHAVVPATSLVRIDRDGLEPAQAATVSVNPCTAHQLLTRFADLKPGDWFIQNGGNSGVGRAAIQLARIWGLNSLSVVRARPDLDALVSELSELGATRVVTEDQVASKQFRATIKEWTGGKDIKLGLNCVGGRSATSVARQLGRGGKLVTYGGMSKQPVTLPTSLFIFKDVSAHGYWLSAWTQADPEGKKQAIEEMLGYMRDGRFRDVPVERNVWRHEASDEEKMGVFERALENATRGFSGKKQVIQFE